MQQMLTQVPSCGPTSTTIIRITNHPNPSTKPNKTAANGPKSNPQYPDCRPSRFQLKPDLESQGKVSRRDVQRSEKNSKVRFWNFWEINPLLGMYLPAPKFSKCLAGNESNLQGKLCFPIFQLNFTHFPKNLQRFLCDFRNRKSAYAVCRDSANTACDANGSGIWPPKTGQTRPPAPRSARLAHL